MHRPSSILVPALLLAVVACLWLTVNAHWNPATWRSPGGPPRGDILEVAARVQIASEQFFHRANTYGKIDRLGAPVGADWSLYPVPDRITFALAGLLASALGVYGAINALMLLAHLLGAGSFYACARLLRWHPAWAAAGALLFSFAVFNQQWSGTLSLGWTFALPPAVLLFQWIASRSSAPPAPVVRRRTWLAAGTGLWLGLGNPYFGFIAGQLLVFSLVLQWCRGRHRARLRVGGIFLLALLAGFICTHAPYLSARLTADGAGTLDRNYAGSEIYALKPVELLLPPPSHRSATLAALGDTYSRISAFRHSDPPSSYLGIAGIAGLLLLLATGLRHTIRRRPDRPVPDAVAATLWVLLFSCVGGINSLLAFLGLDIFRASNRFAIFILVWCLFAFIGWARRRTIGRSGRAWALAAGIVLLGLFDQVARGLSPVNHAAGSAAFAADRATAGRITAAAGPEARVFLLPAVPFPEAGPVNQFTDYEHFRLFLASPRLRLSYGGLRGSLPERWSRWVAGQPPHKLVAELEQRGFSVLICDQRAWSPDQAASRLAGLRSAGAVPLDLPEALHLAAFLLQPVSAPLPPDPADPRYLAAWDDTSSTPPESPLQLHAAAGWFAAERDNGRVWRWAGHDAELALWNDEPAPRPVRLRFSAASLAPGKLVATVEGRRIWEAEISRNPREFHDVELTLPPGATRVTWEFAGSLVRPGAADRRRLGFRLENLTVESR